MLRRNGTKNRSQHPITVNVDKLTRIEKIELFDQLTKNVINAHNRYIAGDVLMQIKYNGLLQKLISFVAFIG